MPAALGSPVASTPVLEDALGEALGGKGQDLMVGEDEEQLAKEPKYCYCNRISFGEMIGCDNDNCKIEWFHTECVGLTAPPKGTWYCPDCRKTKGGRR